MSNDILSRLSQGLKEKIASSPTGKSGRSDLYLADWEQVGPAEARVLIGYSSHYPMPTRMQVTRWVVSSFNGLLDLKLETLKNHQEESAVSAIVAGTLQQKAPLEFAKDMVPVGGDRYASADETIWAVVEQDGQKFLVREATEDITAILDQRSKHVKGGMGAWSTPSFSTITAGITQLEVGDRVRFYMNNIVQQGTIKSVAPNVVKIEVNGDTTPVPPAAVFSVEEKSPAAKKDKIKSLVDFFTKAYGDKSFAQKLVK